MFETLLTAENFMKMYFYVAVFATTVFALKLLLFTVLGSGEGEVHNDFTASTDTDVSFNFISVQSILAFLMGFGWMGYAGLHQFGFTSQIKTFTLAFVLGLIFMIINTFLMFLVRKLEKSVKKDKTTALNHVGKAYTSFAPKGSGKVEIEINGQLTISDAINSTEEEINSFEMVKVVKVENDILYIEKSK